MPIYAFRVCHCPSLVNPIMPFRSKDLLKTGFCRRRPLARYLKTPSTCMLCVLPSVPTCRHTVTPRPSSTSRWAHRRHKWGFFSRRRVLPRKISTNASFVSSSYKSFVKGPSVFDFSAWYPSSLWFHSFHFITFVSFHHSSTFFQLFSRISISVPIAFYTRARSNLCLLM